MTYKKKINTVSFPITHRRASITHTCWNSTHKYDRKTLDEF